MTSCLDHTQDTTGTERHRLTQLYAVPEFVKSASHDQLCGAFRLPSHVYGDIQKRAFPLHTKAATFMSALFFGDRKPLLKTAEAVAIRGRILQAAANYNIKTEVEALWAKMAKDARADESRLSDDIFAMVWVGDNGSKERHYPLRNGTEVEKAAEWFDKYHGEFEFDDRHTIASKILQKSAEHNVTLANADLLDRCAGFGYCPPKQAADAWRQRQAFIQAANPGMAKAAADVANLINSGSVDMRDRDAAVKIASLMDRFDRESGIAEFYGKHGFETPEDTLFVLTEKTASDFAQAHVQTTTGTVYEKSAFTNLRMDHVRNWMGDDFADEVGGVILDTEKMASILPTLPRPEAAAFDQMANAAGIQVFARQKTATAQSLTTTEMQELAAVYRQTVPA